MSVVYHPRLAMGCDRITARQREDNIATDLKDARNMIRSPSFYGTADLRWACSTLETHGDAMDWQIADQMIQALNLRERKDAANIARRNFVSHYDADRPRPRDLGLACVGAVVFVAFAWLSLAVWLTGGAW